MLTEIEKFLFTKRGVTSPRMERYFAFFATQQCLAAQSHRISGTDASLGILVLVQIPILLYLVDKAIILHSLYLWIISAALVLTAALALVALVFIHGTESPEAMIFNEGLQQDSRRNDR